MLKFKQAKISTRIPKNYRANEINEKLKIILPELLARNMKLTDRLKNKLKVSTFLNNTENRNQKYLKMFLSSSDKRVKDIKTGLELSKAVKQSAKNLSNLCNKIDSDIILQNSDFLSHEKKLLNENTEQETHMKINNLISNLKDMVKKIKYIQSPSKDTTNNSKYLSKSYINNINNILKNKLENEKNFVNHKINSYKSKLKNSIQEKKEYKNFADKIDLSNLKLLNYKKPKPIPISDRESSSMARIKNVLYPIMVQSGTSLRQKIINLNPKNIHNNLSFNENGKSQILLKDSFDVLKGLSSNNQKLTTKINKTIQKVNSLIDIKLPNPGLYKILLEKTREEQCGKKSFDLGLKKEIYAPNELEKIINDQKELDKHIQNKMKLQKIINTLKYEVDKFKNIDIAYNSEQNKKINHKIMQRPLLMNYNKIKRQNKLNENSNYIEQTTSVMSKNIFHMNSQSNIKKKDEDSISLNTNSKIYDSVIFK